MLKLALRTLVATVGMIFKISRLWSFLTFTVIMRGHVALCITVLMANIRPYSSTNVSNETLLAIEGAISLHVECTSDAKQMSEHLTDLSTN